MLRSLSLVGRADGYWLPPTTNHSGSHIALLSSVMRVKVLFVRGLGRGRKGSEAPESRDKEVRCLSLRGSGRG